MCVCMFRCVCVFVYTCVPAYVCMHLHVFVNNWEYATAYIQHLCDNTFKNSFLHSNNLCIIKKENGVWNRKTNCDRSSVILELWNGMIELVRTADWPVTLLMVASMYSWNAEMWLEMVLEM